ncbi:hypothetical protein LCGC14_1872260, partial [marine sediment metagenome]
TAFKKNIFVIYILADVVFDDEIGEPI